MQINKVDFENYTFMVVVYKPDGTPLCLTESVEDAQDICDSLNGARLTDARGRSVPKKTKPVNTVNDAATSNEPPDHLFVPLSQDEADTNRCLFCATDRSEHKGPPLANTGDPDQEPVLHSELKPQ
jgi:hypothetical protein